MTELENDVVKQPLASEILNFRYVDDTLVLVKPGDLQFVLQKFNSLHNKFKIYCRGFS